MELLKSWWPMIISGAVGMGIGLPVGAFVNSRGVAGVIEDVKQKVEKVEADVKAIKGRTKKSTAVANPPSA